MFDGLVKIFLLIYLKLEIVQKNLSHLEINFMIQLNVKIILD